MKQKELEQAIMVIAGDCYNISVEHGFWGEIKPNGQRERNFGEAIALIHSELSELLNALMAPKPLTDEHCPEFTNAEIESADVIIRVLDLAIGLDYRIGEAILAKINYNRSRPFKHNKNF